MDNPNGVLRNTIYNADCIEAMRRLDRGSVDFILTDPPYITRYQAREGRTVANDDNAGWLRPAFNQMHRVLKDGGLCVSFYGWSRVGDFMGAWRAAGFRPVGTIRTRGRNGDCPVITWQNFAASKSQCSWLASWVGAVLRARGVARRAHERSPRRTPSRWAEPSLRRGYPRPPRGGVPPFDSVSAGTS